MEVKVAPKGIRLFLSAVVSVTAALLPLPCHADPIPLEQRPFTIFKLLETQYVYVPQLMNKRLGAQGEATSAAARVQAHQERKYERGAEVGEIVQNILHDFQVILGDFFDCLDFKIVGLCYKITWTGIHFDIYRQYRLPVQDVESVQHPYESGFLPKFVNEALLPVSEQTFYPLAKTIAETNNLWVSHSIDLAGNMAGYDFNAADTRFEGNDNAKNDIKTVDRDKRFHNSDDLMGGNRYVEFAVLPQLFNQIMGRLWFFCHDVLFPGVWTSYYPLTILPARMSGFSLLLYPAEMINKMLVPQTCAGVDNQLRGGKTPFDMILTGNQNYDALNLVSPGLGCLKENDGSWVPLTNYHTNSAFSVGSVAATMKGIKTAVKLMPWSFYDIDRSRDRIQWSANDRMPDDCVKLERFVRNFGDANLRKGDDPRNVAIHWRFFRCCARGFHILFGPSPIIRR